MRRAFDCELSQIADAVLRNKENDTIIDIMLDDNGGHYSCEYVSFNIKKEQMEKLTYIALTDVSEQNNYELLEVRLSNLVTWSNAQLITGFLGGKRTNSQKAYAWGYEQRYIQRNVAVLETEEKFCAIDAPYLDDKIHCSIFGLNGVRYASVGVTFTYRLRMYDENESIKVINVPSLYLYTADSMLDVLGYLRSGLKKDHICMIVHCFIIFKLSVTDAGR